VAFDSGQSRGWWDERTLVDGEPGTGGPAAGVDDGIDDGIEVFRAVATGALAPHAALHEDEGVGGRPANGAGVYSALLRRLHGATASFAPGRALVLVVVAVGVVALLISLLGGGSGPAVDPTLPLAGSSGEAPGDAASPTSDAVSGVPAEPRDGASAVDPAVPAGSVVVHVAGAVEHPGVHLLRAGARVHDAIAAAGGPRPDADLDRLNLAAPVADGSQVYVVVAGAVGSGVGGSPGDGDPGGTPAAGGAVSLNAADAAALDALPGVGPSTAAAIIAHREANGPFGSVDDLLDVRGIGAAKLEGLRDLVVP
jgi:competence protein ComEA